MRSRIRVVGGAPPPPLGAAPQGSKNRKNSAEIRPDFGGHFDPEDHAQIRGVGGLQTTTPRDGEGPPWRAIPTTPFEGGLPAGSNRKVDDKVGHLFDLAHRRKPSSRDNVESEQLDPEVWRCRRRPFLSAPRPRSGHGISECHCLTMMRRVAIPRSGH